MINKTGIISALLLIIVSTNLWAEKGYLLAHVRHIVVIDQGTWGGCMVLLDKSVKTQAVTQPPNGFVDCPDHGWVTFSCDGTYSSKDIAYRKLDLAQKSEITGHRVLAYVDDTKKHNGICYAFRFDSLNY